MTVLLWFIRLTLGGIVLFWITVMLKARSTRSKGSHRVGSDEAGPTQGQRLTVVVPARNEQANIGACLESVLAQDLPGLRVVVLNDGSTDRTGEIAREMAARSGGRLVVLEGGGAPLPEGWLGKVWACQRAGQAALAADPPPDWLLFVDADVRLHPRAAAAALGYAERHALAMLSGLGEMETQTFWEHVLQPMIGGLILAGNDLDKINDPARRPERPLANGQFILVRHDAYRAVGGHEAVRANIVDDVGLATAVTAAGFPYHLVFMRTLFRCRMYDSLRSLWEGWTKNLFAGIGHSWARLVLVVWFLSHFMLLPYLVLALGLLGVGGTEGFVWGIVLVGTMHAARAYLDRIFERPLRWGLSHGLAVSMIVALFIRSAVHTTRGTTTWKGRTIQRPSA